MPDLSLNNSFIIPTGSIKLDLSLGIGGIPVGNLIEIVGPEASGKTSLCLSILSEANKLGKYCAFIDTEQCLTDDRLKTYNLNPDLIFLSQISQAEQALDIVERLVRSQVFSIIILDSINTLFPNLDDTYLDTIDPIEYVDKLISNALSKFNRLLYPSKTTVILTRHIFSSNKTVYHRLSQNTARLAVNLQASIIMQLNTVSHIKIKGQIEGWQTQVQIKKNRFGPCPAKTNLDIMYNDGIIKFGEVLELGLRLQILENRSNLIAYRGLILGKNEEESLDFLKSSPLVSRKIEIDIRQNLFSK